MASIRLDQVSVEFPIYHARSHSLKGRMLRMSVGGLLGIDAGHIVRIEALRQISLGLGDGDRLGLIGHNGAGKSTLLTVMAGVYQPCRGAAVISGRVAPLFDPQLGMDLESTGRENILLRGIHLGLTPAQIRPQIEEIADFTGLGPYLAMPLRTYSTGMRMRLAFAVSTAFDPEILLIDEGISAGDAAFIDQAERRLDDFVARAGIVVLASHSEPLVRKLCNRALLLENGAAVRLGGLDEIFDLYRQRRETVPEGAGDL